VPCLWRLLLMAAGKGSQRSGMGWSESPARKRARAQRKRAQERRWAAKASAVTVTFVPVQEDVGGGSDDG